MIFGGVSIPGLPDPANIRLLDTLPVPQIRRMMKVGVAIDREGLWALSDHLEARRVDLRKQIASYVPTQALEQFVTDSSDDLSINPESSDQISDLLFDQLKIGANLDLKKTKSGARISSGKKQLEALKRLHPVIPLILQYREASKLKGTYTDKMPRIARQAADGSWRIYGQIVTTRTETGRLAMRDPNLQNIPARTAEGRRVRAQFIPSPGKAMISVDYSQIELRLLAHASHDENMLRIFLAGGDIHLDTAMRAFNIADPKLVDKMLHRAPCKNVNFGVGYGLGPPGLYDLMAVTFATAGLDMPKWLTIEWCAEFIEKWFALYPMCRNYFELQHYRARRYGIVWTSFGRVRRVPEVYSTHNRIRQAGLRQAGNMPIQGMSADVIKIGMARVERRFEILRQEGIYVEALLSIHDELLIECDPDWADYIKETVTWEMEQALVNTDGVLECRCPILAEGKVMNRWEKD